MPKAPNPRLRATKEALVKTAFAIVYVRQAWQEWAGVQKAHSAARRRRAR